MKEFKVSLFDNFSTNLFLDLFNDTLSAAYESSLKELRTITPDVKGSAGTHCGLH